MIANDKKTHLDTKKSTRDECFLFFKIDFSMLDFVRFWLINQGLALCQIPFGFLHRWARSPSFPHR